MEKELQKSERAPLIIGPLPKWPPHPGLGLAEIWTAEVHPANPPVCGGSAWIASIAF